MVLLIKYLQNDQAGSSIFLAFRLQSGHSKMAPTRKQLKHIYKLVIVQPTEEAVLLAIAEDNFQYRDVLPWYIVQLDSAKKSQINLKKPDIKFLAEELRGRNYVEDEFSLADQENFLLGEARYYLEKNELTKSDISNAINTCDLIIRNCPKGYRAYKLRCLAHQRLQHYKKAYEDCLQALSCLENCSDEIDAEMKKNLRLQLQHTEAFLGMVQLPVPKLHIPYMEYTYSEGLDKPKSYLALQFQSKKLAEIKKYLPDEAINSQLFVGLTLEAMRLGLTTRELLQPSQYPWYIIQVTVKGEDVNTENKIRKLLSEIDLQSMQMKIVLFPPRDQIESLKYAVRNCIDKAVSQEARSNNLELCHKAIQKFPGHFELYQLRGELHEVLKCYAEARYDYLQAIAYLHAEDAVIIEQLQQKIIELERNIRLEKLPEEENARASSSALTTVPITIQSPLEPTPVARVVTDVTAKANTLASQVTTTDLAGYTKNRESQIVAMENQARVLLLQVISFIRDKLAALIKQCKSEDLKSYRGKLNADKLLDEIKALAKRNYSAFNFERLEKEKPLLEEKLQLLQLRYQEVKALAVKQQWQTIYKQDVIAKLPEAWQVVQVERANKQQNFTQNIVANLVQHWQYVQEQRSAAEARKKIYMQQVIAYLPERRLAIQLYWELYRQARAREEGERKIYNQQAYPAVQYRFTRIKHDDPTIKPLERDESRQLSCNYFIHSP